MSGEDKRKPGVASYLIRSYAWIFLVLTGLSMVMFSAYMMLASIEQRSRIIGLVQQTRMLRDALNQDHAWQMEHHRIFEDIERSIRAAVNRKEALIRGAMKKLYGWTDADIEQVINSEIDAVHDINVIPNRSETPPPDFDGKPVRPTGLFLPLGDFPIAPVRVEA